MALLVQCLENLPFGAVEFGDCSVDVCECIPAAKVLAILVLGR